MQIATDVLAALRSATVKTENGIAIVTLPQLDPQLYGRTRDVLQQLGVDWHRSSQDHRGPATTAAALAEAIATGAITHAKRDLHRFETPSSLAADMPMLVDLDDIPAHLLPTGRIRMLEPSAGSGNLIEPVLDQYPDADITAVEIDPAICDRLQARFPSIRVVCADFAAWAARCTDRFDVILANPPFNAKLDHLTAMLRLLASHSFARFATVLPAADHRRQRDLALLDALSAADCTLEPLDPGSFAAAGTQVATMVAWSIGPSRLSIIRRQYPAALPFLAELCALSLAGLRTSVASCNGEPRPPLIHGFPVHATYDDAYDTLEARARAIARKTGLVIHTHCDPRTGIWLAISDDPDRFLGTGVPPVHDLAKVEWCRDLLSPPPAPDLFSLLEVA